MKGITLLCILASLAATVPAFAANNDELWEISSSVEMQGMSMGTGTTTICLRKEGAYQPDQKDPNCTVFDVKSAGNKSSWKMRCTGKDAWTGGGEMLKTATAMKGTMYMVQNGEKTVMKQDGRIVGKCDAAAEEKKIKDALAANKAMHDKGLAEIEAIKKRTCESLRNDISTSYDSYHSYRQTADKDARAQQRMAECNVNLEASRKKLCSKAGPNQFEFAQKYCPAEYAAMKAQYCSGRSGSFQDMCNTITGAGGAVGRIPTGQTYGIPGVGGAVGFIPTGRNYSSSANPIQNAINNPVKSILDGAKDLKGLFGF